MSKKDVEKDIMFMLEIIIMLRNFNHLPATLTNVLYLCDKVTK